MTLKAKKSLLIAALMICCFFGDIMTIETEEKEKKGLVDIIFDDELISSAINEMDCLVLVTELMYIMSIDGRISYANKLTEAIIKRQDPQKVKKPENYESML